MGQQDPRKHYNRLTNIHKHVKRVTPTNMISKELWYTLLSVSKLMDTFASSNSN